MPVSTPRQTLNRLTIIVLIQWMGATLGLPLLPLFLEHRGGSPHVIGLIVAAFFVAGVATQFLLGHLADRFGRRRVLISSLVAYGLASMTYALPLGATWFTLTRVVQGSSAGALEVASMSAVAALFAERERGSAVSRILAAQLMGAAVGPMAGIVASVSDLGWVFFVTGVISLGAAVVAFNTNLGDEAYDPSPLPPMHWNRPFVGALVAAAAVGLAVGVYETCWSLLMHAHHATTLQIRLSWTMFCLPWVLLSRVGGWIADHLNRRLIALYGLLNGAAFLATYPHIHNNVAMLFLGSFESIGSALSSPSIASLLSQGAQSRELSRRQGLYATSTTASMALAAVSSGYLFTIDSALPFTLVAVVSSGLAISTLYFWRRVEGRISPAPSANSPVG
ncbi:MAG: MFS transporter [Acidobacteriota bacterium]|nr:MFS transporter [Acidobacteriota bacterium]MDE3030968.1 MFS transporter [Acidobacteriota bacterium]MDE3093290.1 MFS transporter [Acidobacteriota bacterium]MDE3139981.1 MFS transporter [Acidobacteriota bacterium]MDE3147375.1 MFS transporter [Acidobacteriota bacterium]